MRKLTYWVAKCTGDSDAYSIRARTKQEVVRELENSGNEDYDPPKKVTAEYENVFELLRQCLGEGRGYWEG